MSAKKTLIVIPARLAATRLPNKPLADICGKPMIVHVWEKAIKANVGPVIVACGDQEIVEAIKSFGGEAIYTDPSLPSGTDRVKAAADVYDPQNKYDFIINVQGDLPTLEPSLICEVLDPFQNTTVDIATLATTISDLQELSDSNVVKIALSVNAEETIGRALYFSRNPIPSGEGPHYHHIGLYAYRRHILNQFVELAVDPIEAREKLEQLRALAAGMRIDVKIIDTHAPFGVDTQSDLERAITIIGESYTL
ncbi:MAG: 3-deoxy-manno-octulosonate cytidylyltransferase [Proteobacteria bacterium]|nr:3-deoxy-manno-octulosonate cytidylyltransferase [Pseudomonadota bacterium]